MFAAISDTVFRDGMLQPLTAEQEKCKREIYEKMNPRRRKFIDRLGYKNWDPFQKPNDPLDLRTDATKCTTGQLVNNFLRHAARQGEHGNDYGKGAWECALGIVNNDEKYQGIFDFCIWYYDLLQREGNLE
ncbi:MAG: hypothetical protein LBS77_07605 [Desulfovibrio sp.]|jgi:hypothetical protein|nr:hypothetical protein [Desulfovibrio sp.]